MKKSYHSIAAPIEAAIATRVTDCAATCSVREFSTLGFIDYAPSRKIGEPCSAPDPCANDKSCIRRKTGRPSVVHAFLEFQAGVLQRAQAALIHADPFRLVVQELAVAHFLAGRGNIGELGNRRPPGLRGDGREEVLF